MRGFLFVFYAGGTRLNVIRPILTTAEIVVPDHPVITTRGRMLAGFAGTTNFVVWKIPLHATGGGNYAAKASNKQTSLGAKVAMMFCGYGPSSLGPLATRFSLPSTLVRQAETMFNMDILLGVSNQDQAVRDLYNLVERLRKAPEGAGMSFIQEWAEDEHAPELALKLWHKIQQMDNLFDAIRFQTHVDSTTPRNQINIRLRELRIEAMSKI